MNSNKLSPARLGIGLVALAGLLGAGGCATAAAAAAGKIVDFAYTDRGASSELKGSIKQIDEQAKKAFEKMGIITTRVTVEEGGTKRILEGTSGDLNVHATLTAQGDDFTYVEVTAQKSWVQWNKDYARYVIENMARAG